MLSASHSCRSAPSSPFAILAISLVGTLLMILAEAQSLPSSRAGDFVNRPDLIFVGTLLDQQSSRTPDGRHIETLYTFRVDQELKGATDGTVRIFEYGGRFGDLQETISHAARYSKGRTYLIFSHIGAADQRSTFAGSDGKLPVVRDRRGSLWVRIYPDHPLRALFEERRAFQNLNDLDRLLEESVLDQ